MLALGRKQIEEGQVSSHDEFFASLEAADDEVATNAENLKSGQAKFLLLAFRIEKNAVGREPDGMHSGDAALFRAILSDIETVEVHHFCPRGHEIPHKLLLRVSSGINLGDCAQLCVRAKDQVDPRGSPT